VPKVIGMTLTRAKKAIKSAGCRSGRIRMTRSGRRPGIVIAQRPRPKSLVPAGTAIALVVSSGPRTQH
jgi:beta-lactam-binding protein with PASTA domain